MSMFVYFILWNDIQGSLLLWLFFCCCWKINIEWPSIWKKNKCLKQLNTDTFEQWIWLKISVAFTLVLEHDLYQRIGIHGDLRLNGILTLYIMFHLLWKIHICLLLHVFNFTHNKISVLIQMHRRRTRVSDFMRKMSENEFHFNG